MRRTGWRSEDLSEKVEGAVTPLHTGEEYELLAVGGRGKINSSARKGNPPDIPKPLKTRETKEGRTLVHHFIYANADKEIQAKKLKKLLRGERRREVDTDPVTGVITVTVYKGKEVFKEVYTPTENEPVFFLRIRQEGGGEVQKQLDKWGYTLRGDVAYFPHADIDEVIAFFKTKGIIIVEKAHVDREEGAVALMEKGEVLVTRVGGEGSGGFEGEPHRNKPPTKDGGTS